ncbi:hypothetical protein Desor_3591 [Desulfosporosinus orientis DSM 765]|uniref:DinB family protein n=1 Tax=Desulfosporosinus orientis (strain ATCC 19365 / DSM 765 / NCIMB 8382 / VKM B-1628 / Singapore I) TaxID=768706 RepID=G7WIJ8_DESOD|nr:DinB family protein [Desulfosporosinus orientis]AET69072.1 hypothetical protein Desor_3591 [Desulfosporosinus orientis DSM 765]
MNKQQIMELYGYNDWANHKLFEAMSSLEHEEFSRNLGSSFGSMRDTLVHIVGAEELWLSRWRGEQGRTLLKAEDFPDYSTLAEHWYNFQSQMRGFLESLAEEELQEIISYKNIHGNPYSLELWKQMLHVINHSSFHRGQIVTMLRQLKKQPPSCDLVYYYLGKR